VNLPPSPEPRPNPFEPPPVASYGGGTIGRHGAPTPPASSEAVAALVCGLMAWACFPLGVLALWLGTRARRAVRENPNFVGGDQMALAGMIIGGIFVALGCLVLLLYFGLFAVAFGLHAFK
jgi:hypothetical protein